MKVQVNESEEFKPIVLTITIESKEELAEMFARHSLCLVDVKEMLTINVNYKPIMDLLDITSDDTSFYNELNRLYKRIKPETR